MKWGEKSLINGRYYECNGENVDIGFWINGKTNEFKHIEVFINSSNPTTCSPLAIKKAIRGATEGRILTRELVKSVTETILALEGLK